MFFSKIVFLLIFTFHRRTSGPIVKRIDNYGPPNAKSPFGHSDDKSDSKSEISAEEKVIRKSESQSADENAAHIDSSGKLSIELKCVTTDSTLIITISIFIRFKNGKS